MDYFGSEGVDYGHGYSNDETNRFYAGQVGISPKSYLNLGNLHNEELASLLGSTNQYLGINGSHLTPNQ